MKKGPSSIALKFLRWFCREDSVEEVEGDLIELYELQKVKASHRVANFYFIMNVVKSFRPGLIKSVRIQQMNLHMLTHYARHGAKNMLRYKDYSLLNITGLTIGMMCCLMLLIFARFESTFDGFHPYAERTFRIVQQTRFPDQTLYWNTTAFPLAEAIRNDFSNIPIVTQCAGPTERYFTARSGEIKFESKYVLFVDSLYTKVFPPEWLAGNVKTAFDLPNSVVLSVSLAKKCLPDPNDQLGSLVGSTILLNDKDEMVVTGIVKDAPANTSLRYEMLIPYKFFRMNNPYPANNWSGNYNGTTFVVLDDQNEYTEIQRQIATWKSKYLNEDDNQRISYLLQPLSSIHNETLYGAPPGGYFISDKLLLVAKGIGLFILLIAIANFINLLTARATSRHKELAVRRVIGGTNNALITQVIVENCLVVLTSLVVAVAATHYALQIVNQYLQDMHFELELSLKDIPLIFGVGISTILLGTLYPAIIVSRLQPAEIFRGSIASKTRGVTIRKALVVFQFVIVQAFVMGAIIVTSQLDYFRNKDLGFNKDAVVMIPVPDQNKLEPFRNALLQKNDVTNVSFGSGPPMAVNGFSLGTLFRLASEPEIEGRETEIKVADPQYFPLYGIDLVSGRIYSALKNPFDEFVVNERFVKMLNTNPDDAIGLRIAINEGEGTIVGVVRDFHNVSLQNEIGACVFANWTAFQDNAFVKFNHASPDALEGVQKEWNRHFSKGIYQYQFVDAAMAREYKIEELSLFGVRAFTIVSVIMGGIGILGMMTYLISMRRKEAGVRKVFGAAIIDILFFFGREIVATVAIAFCISIPVVIIAMNSWLENFTYRIPLSPWMIATGVILTFSFAALVTAWNVFRAATANPVEVLKENR